MNQNFSLFLISLVLFSTSCTAVRLEPTAEAISQADYGEQPEAIELPTDARRYLKKAGYFDPNGAEIEDCRDIKKGWLREPFSSVSELSFTFGWLTVCDVNGKNRFGGFVGFQPMQYLFKNGQIVGGQIPGAANTALKFGWSEVPPLKTPESRFVVWE